MREVIELKPTPYISVRPHAALLLFLILELWQQVLESMDGMYQASELCFCLVNDPGGAGIHKVGQEQKRVGNNGRSFPFGVSET